MCGRLFPNTGTVNQLCITIGILIVNLLGLIYEPTQDWWNRLLIYSLYVTKSFLRCLSLALLLSIVFLFFSIKVCLLTLFLSDSCCIKHLVDLVQHSHCGAPGRRLVWTRNTAVATQPRTSRRSRCVITIFAVLCLACETCMMMFVLCVQNWH